MAKNDEKTKKPVDLDSNEPPWARKGKAPEDERDEDEEEDEDEEDEDEEPVADQKASAADEDEDEEDEDEEDEDEDEDEEDEDEEEEEEPPPPPKSRGTSRGPARAASRAAPTSKRPTPSARRREPPAAEDNLPDWLPWVVMLGLIGIGGAGALGLFSSKGTPASDAPAEEASAAPAAAVPDQIAAQHLLVAYKGAMRANPAVTRSKEEAKARAEEAQRKAKGGGDFGALVGEYSDEPGAATRKGNLGKFSRQMMVKPFSDAAFSLKVGEISGVVETPFGFHVIKRTE